MDALMCIHKVYLFAYRMCLLAAKDAYYSTWLSQAALHTVLPRLYKAMALFPVQSQP